MKLIKSETKCTIAINEIDVRKHIICIQHNHVIYKLHYLNEIYSFISLNNSEDILEENTNLNELLNNMVELYDVKVFTNIIDFICWLEIIYFKN